MRKEDLINISKLKRIDECPDPLTSGRVPGKGKYIAKSYK